MTDVLAGRPWRIVQGDALEVLRGLPDGSFDALVTDPPSGIGFMGKAWDKDRGGRAQWTAWLAEILLEARRVLKPGAWGVVWALPRTTHWTACALEDAGFQIRDRVAHLFGQGWPKSKASLKPAAEDWWLVRAPGPQRDLQIDACRIPGTVGTCDREPGNVSRDNYRTGGAAPGTYHFVDRGRWPANVVLDDFTAELLDEQSGELTSGAGAFKRASGLGYKGMTYGEDSRPEGAEQRSYGDTGGASRFFYVAKPSAAERHNGVRNTHPTVKPVALMQHLCKLVTPPDGLILDPFCGSGTTLIAARRDGFRALGIDEDADSVELARRRVETDVADAPLFERLG